MPSITPFLWYDNNAEEAAKFYTSIFKNSRIVFESRNGDGGPGPAGSVWFVRFELDGQPFMALNGGPLFQFTEAVSFMVDCADQAEIDYYWERLTAGSNQPGQCGWLKDKFGLSWQIVPTVLGELMSGGPEKSARVMAALMQMTKLDIATLQKAYDEA